MLSIKQLKAYFKRIGFDFQFNSDSKLEELKPSIELLYKLHELKQILFNEQLFNYFIPNVDARIVAINTLYKDMSDKLDAAFEKFNPELRFRK